MVQIRGPQSLYVPSMDHETLTYSRITDPPNRVAQGGKLIATECPSSKPGALTRSETQFLSLAGPKAAGDGAFCFLSFFFIKKISLFTRHYGHSWTKDPVALLTTLKVIPFPFTNVTWACPTPLPMSRIRMTTKLAKDTALPPAG